MLHPQPLVCVHCETTPPILHAMHASHSGVLVAVCLPLSTLTHRVTGVVLRHLAQHEHLLGGGGHNQCVPPVVVVDARHAVRGSVQLDSGVYSACTPQHRTQHASAREHDRVFLPIAGQRPASNQCKAVPIGAGSRRCKGAKETEPMSAATHPGHCRPHTRCEWPCCLRLPQTARCRLS